MRVTQASGAELRAVAARALQRVIVDGASLRSVLPEASLALSDARDRALLRAMLYEAARWHERLSVWLKALLKRPLPARAAVIEALLRIGLTQLEILRLPEHAAVAATVEAARSLQQPALAGLVNAVLRAFQRRRDELMKLAEDSTCARYSHPQWMIDALRQDWPDDWPALLEANNRAAPLWLRINTRRIAPADYAARLAERGLLASATRLLPEALILQDSVDVTGLPGFAEGLLSVQDGAAQWAPQLLDLRPGQRVLDACAAPGGKTCHILERAENLAELVAIDSVEARLRPLRESLQRLGLTAKVLCADATQPQAWWDGRPFDRILLDAPCSGSGVIRRQPDIKLHRRADDIVALAALQSRLLRVLWPLLAPGGRLVYATCSVFKAETADVLAAFLRDTPDAVAQDVPAAFGRGAGAGRQNLPGHDAMDGFFYAIVDKAA